MCIDKLVGVKSIMNFCSVTSIHPPNFSTAATIKYWYTTTTSAIMEYKIANTLTVSHTIVHTIARYYDIYCQTYCLYMAKFRKIFSIYTVYVSVVYVYYFLFF